MPAWFHWFQDPMPACFIIHHHVSFPDSNCPVPPSAGHSAWKWWMTRHVHASHRVAWYGLYNPRTVLVEKVEVAIWRPRGNDRSIRTDITANMVTSNLEPNKSPNKIVINFTELANKHILRQQSNIWRWSAGDLRGSITELQCPDNNVGAWERYQQPSFAFSDSHFTPELKKYILPTFK